ncbi:MAG: hypothetical protein GY806_01775 [Gammaproteobacteria bacterium]|nr:hypothetical protein [Gammaproteobacteria bacterium]
MKEIKNDKLVILDSQKIEEKSEELQKPYVAPKCDTHNPLKIMSAWQDNSSELEF